jgi:hypothetical protein
VRAERMDILLLPIMVLDTLEQLVTFLDTNNGNNNAVYQL